MNIQPHNHDTLNALLDRKVGPLGADEYVLHIAKQRAWRRVCRGDYAAAALRDAVNYAATQADKPAGNRQGGEL